VPIVLEAFCFELQKQTLDKGSGDARPNVLLQVGPLASLAHLPSAAPLPDEPRSVNAILVLFALALSQPAFENTPGTPKSGGRDQ
jgi:hypothetical protein